MPYLQHPHGLFSARTVLVAACRQHFDLPRRSVEPHRVLAVCTNRLAAAPPEAAQQFFATTHRQLQQNLSATVQNLDDEVMVESQQTFGCAVSTIPGYSRFDMRVETCRLYLQALFPEELADHHVILNDRLDKLYRHGLDFLYGMVFRHAFFLVPPRQQQQQQQAIRLSAPLNLTAFSVAVHTGRFHSRQPAPPVVDDSPHTHKKSNKEIACLQKTMMSRRDDHQRTCQILLLSNDAATTAALTQQIQAEWEFCQVIVVRHSAAANDSLSSTNSMYWQDFVLGLEARNGLVVTNRRSSGILQNVWVYDRTMERILGGWHDDDKGDQEKNDDDKLDICIHQWDGPERPDWPTTT